MHKFLVFTLIILFATSYKVSASLTGPDSAANNPPGNTSTSRSGSGVTVNDPAIQGNTATTAQNTGNLVDAFNKYTGIFMEYMQGLARENTLSDTANSGQTRVALNGLAVEQGIKDQQVAATDITVNNMGTAEGLCSYASTGRGIGPAQGRAFDFFKQDMEKRGKQANKESGTTFENGLIDGLRKIFDDQTTALCSPAGNGGDNAAFCGGDGSNKHLQISSVLYDRNIMPDELPKVTYLEELLTNTRTHVSVNPDLLANANTEAKALFVLSDRLQAEMSMLDAVFGKIKSNNVYIDTDSRAVPFLADTLIQGGYIPDNLKNELLPPGGSSASYMGQLEALVAGMMNPTYYREKASGGEGAWRPAMLYQLILSNHLQLEQIKLLEAIALATSTTVVVNREPALEELNGRISALNARQ